MPRESSDAYRVPLGAPDHWIVLPGMDRPVSISTDPTRPTTLEAATPSSLAVRGPWCPAPAIVLLEEISLTLPPRRGQDEVHPLLNDVSFGIGSGGLASIIGPSGVGKSTIGNIITGQIQPSTGEVTIGGIQRTPDTLEELRLLLGLVPQADLLHDDLTVDQLLEAVADLRLPDLTTREKGERIDQCVALVNLNAHRTKNARDLSGGQRKRVSLATALVARPSVLLCDEPTTGLDPGSEREVITCLRTLAELNYTVIAITHSPAMVAASHQVIAIGGNSETGAGEVAFAGTPQQMRDYFDPGHDLPDSQAEGVMYQQLLRLAPDHATTEPGRSMFNRNVHDHLHTLAHRQLDEPHPTPWASPFQQVRILLRRTTTAARQARDRWLQLAQAPGLAGLLWLLLGPGNLNAAHPGDPRLVTVFVTFAALILGFNNGSRELVSERLIYQRERLVGLSLPAYITSKVAWLTVLTVWQAAWLTAFIATQNRTRTGLLIDSGLTETLAILAVLILAAGTCGLLISAVAASERAAQLIVTLIVVLQLLLTGSFLSVEKPALIGPALSTPAYWGFAATAASAHMTELEDQCQDDGQPKPVPPQVSAVVHIKTPTCSARWAPSSRNVGTALLALATQTLLAAIATTIVLRRKEPGRD